VEKEESMRAMDCDCGHHLEAPDDEHLFERAREHVDRDHPEMQLSDEQVRGLVSEKAYTQDGEGPQTAEGGGAIDQRASGSG
jgi:predicted small metal-binding protein